MKEISEMTNEELIEKIKRGFWSYHLWSDATDGSSGACWDYEVKPYYEEMEKRGLDPEQYRIKRG